MKNLNEKEIKCRISGEDNGKKKNIKRRMKKRTRERWEEIKGRGRRRKREREWKRRLYRWRESRGWYRWRKREVWQRIKIKGEIKERDKGDDDKKKKRERENKKCDKEGRKTRMAAHKWEKKKGDKRENNGETGLEVKEKN